MKRYNNQILIFGSKGFIAQNLINFLKNIDCSFKAFGQKDLDLISQEECKKKLSKIQYKEVTIIFLSALRPSLGDKLDLTIKNLEMIKNLLSNIEINTIKQFIYISSDAVYPYTKKIINEKTSVEPQSIYGTMHYMREQYISSFIPSAKLTILRPCAIYGKGETIFNYGINKFLKDASEKKIINLFGKGEEKRDHILVDDFVKIIYLSYKKNITGLFNVATGKEKTFLQISHYINIALNKSIKNIYKERKQKVMHRRFDITHLQNNFKDVDLNSIKQGVSKLVKSTN